MSNVWRTKLGILLEKNASCTTIQSHKISMPRLFSLAHPLDEMCPVLIKLNNGNISYIIDSDYKVVFASADTDLVLLFDNKIGKHFVAKLRKATTDETNIVCKLIVPFHKTKKKITFEIVKFYFVLKVQMIQQ